MTNMTNIYSSPGLKIQPFLRCTHVYHGNLRLFSRRCLGMSLCGLWFQCANSYNSFATCQVRVSMSECHRDHSKKVSLQVCPLFCLDIFSIFQYISWSYPSFSTPLAALPLDSLSPEASTSATTTITTTTVARAAGWFFLAGKDGERPAISRYCLE